MDEKYENEIKYYIIKKEFLKIHNILLKIQEHINTNYKILMFSLSNNLSILNNLLEQLLNVYNENINNLSIDKLENTINIEKIYNNIENDNNLNLIKESKYSKYIKYNPLKEIKENILILCKIVGFPNLEVLIYLITNKTNIIFTNKKDKEINELLKTIFFPLNYEIKNIVNNETKISKINKIENNINTFIFDKFYEIEYCFNGLNIIIKGFSKKDNINMNILTSQLSYPFIYNIKELFEKKIEEDKYCINNIHINKDFIDKYFNNMEILDYLSYTYENMSERLSNDYFKYNEYDKLSLLKLLKLFTKDAKENIYNMFNIIRILLYGNKNNVSVVNLLFDLLKDKKTTRENEYITNIIYEQLSYKNQVLLLNYKFDINNELDKLKNLSMQDMDMKNQLILSKSMPDYVKRLCYDKIEELKSSNNETYKIKMYINYLLKYPWISNSDDDIFSILKDNKEKIKLFLNDIENKMDKNIYGHTEPKRKVIEMLSKIIKVPGTTIQPIALVGPSGVGKTRFAKILSNCLDLPFIQITLGGQNDGELLHGHGYTYSSAQPGLIIKKMCEAENARCIMFFDELDKCLNRDGKESDIMNILIHLIDPMTNSSFQDRFYQEVTFPLNKVIFIFSFNEIPKISSYLLKRLEVININNYVLEDKLKITREHLLKQLCIESGFDFESIVFNDETLKFLINEYTMEAGVRDLRIKIDNILSKLNVDYLKQKGLFKDDVVYNKENPLIIDKELIINIFGHPKNIEKITHPKSCIGFTNGLYTSGNEIGGILSIQVVKNNYGNKDNFMIEITGNLKKVMKESVKYAFNCAMNIVSEKQKKSFYKNYPQGVFCHFSDASSVKDGPSAGSAIFLTFYSVIVNKKINNKIALTGEIDMFGNIKAIGGVRLKMQGAYKSGIETVFLPEENKNDIEEIIKNKSIEFNSTKKYILVSNVNDIISNVFND